MPQHCSRLLILKPSAEDRWRVNKCSTLPCTTNWVHWRKHAKPLESTSLQQEFDGRNAFAVVSVELSRRIQNPRFPVEMRGEISGEEMIERVTSYSW